MEIVHRSQLQKMKKETARDAFPTLGINSMWRIRDIFHNISLHIYGFFIKTSWINVIFCDGIKKSCTGLNDERPQKIVDFADDSGYFTAFCVLSRQKRLKMPFIKKGGIPQNKKDRKENLIIFLPTITNFCLFFTGKNMIAKNISNCWYFQEIFA